MVSTNVFATNLKYKFLATLLTSYVFVIHLLTQAKARRLVFLYITFLTYSHTKKSNRVRLGDRAGHSIIPRLSIHRFGNIRLRYCRTLN